MFSLGRSAVTESSDRLVHSRLDSVAVRPLIEELSHEYSTRYADYHGFTRPEDAPAEIELFPAQVFAPPYGDLLLIRRGEETIAGGAFMYLDHETAEIKRVWTSSEHRRQGLSRRIMTALENAIVERGYRNAYLTTGPRQPEARNLYLNLGYTPLFDLEADPETIGELAFEKVLAPGNDGPRLRGLLDRWRGFRQRRLVEKTYRWREQPETRLSAL